MVPDTLMKEVLKRSLMGGFMTKSDFARRYADEVACAASSGWITTRTDPHDEIYSNTWYITPKGMMALEHKYYAAKKQTKA